MKPCLFALAVLSMLLAACSGGTKQQPPTPAATPTEAATTSVPPSPTPPETFRPVFRDAPDAFVRLSFAPGQAIDAKRGVFFMDTASGAIEGWALSDAAIVSDGGDPQSCCMDPYVSDDNRFIATRGQKTAWLFDRKTEKTVSWDASQFAFVVATPHRLLFQQAAHPGSDTPPEPSGRYAVLDDSFQPVSTFDVAHEGRGNAPVLFSPDEGTLIVPAGNKNWSDFTVLDQVDLATGVVRQLGQLPVVAPGDQPRPPEFSILNGGAEWAIATNDGHMWDSTRTVVRRYAWDGRLLAEFQVPSSTVAFSPDGRFIAYEQTERFVTQQPDGPYEDWSNVVVADGTTGAPILRVRSASLYFGDGLGEPRWLFDSSAIPIAVRPRSPRLPDVATWLYTGYALLFAGERRLQPLDLVEDSVLGPVPAPDRSALVAVGHTGLLDLQAGRRLVANTAETWLGHVAPWGTTSTELRFALPHGGHGGGGPGTFLSPRIEYPPFNNRLAFTVSGTGSCLNLRSLPAASAPASDCLKDGIGVVLSDPVPAEPNGRLAAWFADEVLWIHVQTTDGKEGWMSSQYLSW